MTHSRSRKPPSAPQKSEKQIASEYLGDFQVEGSRGYRLVKSICPEENLDRKGLMNLAILFSSATGVEFTRSYQRLRPLVIKFLDDNYDTFAVFAPMIRVEVVNNKKQD
jgi:hypothetical protein